MVSTTSFPAARQRDPPTFSGTGMIDVEDWLATYERVGKYNGWNDAAKLNNVAFYLTDIAKTWFLNHEADLPSWTSFSTRVGELFGKPASRKAEAQEKLSRRIQLEGEKYISYIEDILTLCSRADAAMPEPVKINHIMKGISQEAFQFLVTKSPSTVQQLVELCQALQDATNNHVRRPPVTAYGQTNLPAIESANIDSLRSLIRDIVREELQRLATPPSGQSLSTASPGLQTLIQQEVSTVLAENQPSPPRPSSADVVRSPPAPRPLPRPAPGYEAAAETVATMYSTGVPPSLRYRLSPFARQTETRTCFYCGIRGHILRNCRKRLWDMQEQEYQWTPRPPFSPPRRPYYADSNGTQRYDTSDQADVPPVRRRRSLSPRPRQTCRSPIRNRSTSPSEGNE